LAQLSFDRGPERQLSDPVGYPTKESWRVPVGKATVHLGVGLRDSTRGP
jgi:hypothetical protein